MSQFWNSVSRRKFLVISGGGILSSFLLKGCSDKPADNSVNISGEDEKALYEAAKKEGKLIYYTVFFNQEVVNEIGAAFTKKYPGIQFEGTRKVASALFQQLNQEMQSGVKNCDVFGTTDVGQMLKLKESQKLLVYTPKGQDKVRAEFRKLDPDNAFQTGAIIPIVIGYNTQKMKATEAPKAWADLIKPQYKDKIATGSGAASGQVGTWAIAIDEKFGWDKYFPAFSKLNPKLGRSINDAVTDVVSGERAVGIITLGQMLTQKAKGNPVEVVYPTEGAVVLVGPVGILKDAPHTNAAKLFMNFMMSPEYAALTAKYYEQPLLPEVVVKDTKTLAAMKPIIPAVDKIKTGIPLIKKKWRDVFGA